MDTLNNPPSSEHYQGPLVGETYELPGGYLLQTPHPAAIEALKAQDPRIQYVPANPDDIQKAQPGEGRWGMDEAGFHYYDTLVARPLAEQAARDFPDFPQALHRGTVVSLFDERLHYEDRLWVTYEGEEDDERLWAPRNLNNVETILATGSDRAGPLGNMATLSLIDGEVDMLETVVDGLYAHTADAVDVRRERDSEQSADHLFPGLAIYRLEDLRAFRKDPEHFDRSKLITTLYITDRVIRQPN